MYQHLRYILLLCTYTGTIKHIQRDGQNQQMEENKELVRKFMRGASRLLSKDGGEIHMAHKTKPPYNQWKIEQIAMEGWQKRKTSEGVPSTDNFLCYKGRLVLDRCCFPPYRPRKALDKKSFSCHDACIYIFGWDGNVDGGTGFVSTISEDEVLHYDARNRSILSEGCDKAIVYVNTELIDCIRSLHLKEKLKPKRKKYASSNHQFYKGRKKTRR